MSEVKARGVAILQGARKLQLLREGRRNGEDPSPLGQIGAQMKALARSVAIAKFDMPVGRIGVRGPCVQGAVRTW